MTATSGRSDWSTRELAIEAFSTTGETISHFRIIDKLGQRMSGAASAYFMDF